MQEDRYGNPVLPKELGRRSDKAAASGAAEVVISEKFGIHSMDDADFLRCGAPQDPEIEGEDSMFDGESMSPLKRKTASILESWVVELLIILLIFVDLVIIGIECGIDYDMICFRGSVVPMAPGPLKSLVRLHTTESSGEAHANSTQIAAKMDSHAAAHANSTQIAAKMDSHDAANATELSLSQVERWLEIHILDDAIGKPQNSGSLLQVQSWGKEGMRQGPQIPVIKHNKDEPNVAETSEHAFEGGSTEAAHAHSQHAHEAHGGHAAHAATALVCEGKHGGLKHNVLHTCHYASLTILGIFLMENLLKLWINPHHFLSSKMHVLDFTVVGCSFLLDMFLPAIIEKFSKNKDSSKLEMGGDVVAALLMLLRLWRVVRVFHGIFETAHKAYRKVTELSAEVEQLKEKLAEFEEPVRGRSGLSSRSKSSILQ